MGIGEVGERLRRSTVLVQNGDERSGLSESGSGTVWDASGVIVTNAHVVRSGNLTIGFWDGRTARARLERRDNRRDLAILHCDVRPAEPALHNDFVRPRVGELVIAVGNPLGFIGALSTGVVHAVGPFRGFGGQEFVHTTARLAPGNSGGPLAGASGHVMGINTAVVVGGLGLAVPADAVGRLLTAGPSFELGVSLRAVRISGPDRGIALLVLGVVPDSPAEYASLRVGDLLIGADGGRFSGIENLRDCLDRVKAQSMTIQFLRGGVTGKREVTIRATQGVAA